MRKNLMPVFKLSVCLLAATLALSCSGCSDEPAKAALRPVGVLSREVNSPDAARRREAWRELQAHGPGAAEVLPMLVQQLRSDDPVSRLRAAEVMGTIGPGALEAAAGLLAADGPADKRAGALALGELREHGCASVADLLDATESVYPEVRSAAALALGKVVAACQPAAVEPPTSVRITDPRLTELAEIVVGKDGAASKVGGGYAEVRHVRPEAGGIRRSLGVLGIDADQAGQLPDEAPPEVEISLGWGSGPAKPQGPRETKRALERLAAMLAEDEDPVARAAAARGLGEAGDLAGDHVESLAWGLRDEEEAVAQDCAWALGRIGGKMGRAAAEALQEARPFVAASVRPAVDAALEDLAGK